MKNETKQVLVDIRNSVMRFEFSRINRNDAFTRACREIEHVTRLSVGQGDVVFGTSPLRIDQLELLDDTLAKNPGWLEHEGYPLNIVEFIEQNIDFSSPTSMSFYSSKSRSVELFWVPLVVGCKRLQCRIEELRDVLLLLGCAQAYIHYGKDADGRAWRNNDLYRDAKGAQRELIGCWGRYFVGRVLCLSATANDYRRFDTFIKLLMLQPPEYRGHLAWVSEKESSRYVVHQLLTEEIPVKEVSDASPTLAPTSIEPEDGANKKHVSWRPLRSISESVRMEMLRLRESDALPTVEEFTARLNIHDQFLNQAVELF